MPHRYDLRLLDYVCAIADTGSISAAARRLNVSQPTLTRQLTQLERQLGARLFDRSLTASTPTTAGAAFVNRSRSILRSADQLAEEVRLADSGLLGRLRLGFTGSAINGPLGTALPLLRAKLPRIELELREEFNDSDLVSALRSGQLDIAVHRLQTHDRSLLSQPWVREPMTLYLPQRHPLAAAASPVPLGALKGLPIVMWSRAQAPQAYDEVLAIHRQAEVTPHIAATASTVQTILALVAAGFGAAIMADSYRCLQREGVRHRSIAGIDTTIYLTTAAHDRPAVIDRATALLETSRDL